MNVSVDEAVRDDQQREYEGSTEDEEQQRAQRWPSKYPGGHEYSRRVTSDRDLKPANIIWIGHGRFYIPFLPQIGHFSDEV